MFYRVSLDSVIEGLCRAILIISHQKYNQQVFHSSMHLFVNLKVTTAALNSYLKSLQICA